MSLGLIIGRAGKKKKKKRTCKRRGSAAGRRRHWTAWDEGIGRRGTETWIGDVGRLGAWVGLGITLGSAWAGDVEAGGGIGFGEAGGGIGFGEIGDGAWDGSAEQIGDDELTGKLRDEGDEGAGRPGWSCDHLGLYVKPPVLLSLPTLDKKSILATSTHSLSSSLTPPCIHLCLPPRTTASAPSFAEISLVKTNSTTQNFSRCVKPIPDK
ncbi:hypothetical protein SO802_001234 [Lithocarpus litseifolius]|uniref:Uncharacterized protein n=1 Tax=Lithocarpus litseifolius TaxID=425828 RepID=A0AAW2DXS7_9ROSI